MSRASRCARSRRTGCCSSHRRAGRLRSGSTHRERPARAARGAATLYLLITGVVVALLLSNLSEELQLTLPWVDAVLHQVAPALLVLDWLLDSPRHPTSARRALLWLAYPLAWILYTLVRGEIVAWYPYPFVDVSAQGYDGVLLASAGLAIGFTAAALLVATVGTRLRGRGAGS